MKQFLYEFGMKLFCLFEVKKKIRKGLGTESNASIS